jgi:hypothetical protein
MMRWIIKNPAPLDSRQQKWGDFHFGRLLTKHLERRDHRVVSHYDGEWEERADEPTDIVLLLRGKYALPNSARHRGAVHVMWNISHPAAVTMSEYDAFDTICVASYSWADRLSKKLGRRAWPLLQCTDPEEFYDRSSGDIGRRSGVAFVGNTRDVERPIVNWAFGSGLPLQLYGRGWGAFGLADRVVADYVPNDLLGELYSSLRFTLNDHWGDMAEFGFVNNRVFDALACGLPLISDRHDELVSLFPHGLVYCTDRESFEKGLRKMMIEYLEVVDAVQAQQVTIHRDHSFNSRCDQLLRAIGVSHSDDRPAGAGDGPT